MAEQTSRHEKKQRERTALYPIRVAIAQGLAVLLPPLLTLVIFVWVFHLIEAYVFEPVRLAARESIVWVIADIRHEDQVWPDLAQVPSEERLRRNPLIQGVRYQLLPNGDYVPLSVYQRVLAERVPRRELSTGEDVYRYFVDATYLQPWKVAVVFICVLVLVLYLLGKFFAARMGRLMWTSFESTIVHFPVVRTVYSAVKQVSDFLLNEQRISASRVVAVEWPRKGSWALGFVTSEGMKDVRRTAGEPILTVLVATSPMPMTGFTIQVRKSETVDLDIPIDEAFQFIISCGVVVPPEQLDQLQSGSNEPSLIAAGRESAPEGNTGH